MLAVSDVGCRTSPNQRDHCPPGRENRRARRLLPPGRQEVLDCPGGQDRERTSFFEREAVSRSAIFKYSGFENALAIVKQIYEAGGKGHSYGIYSFDDEQFHRLALAAPVSRMIVRQPLQS